MPEGVCHVGYVALMMTANGVNHMMIEKILESIEKLHGGEREQASKRQSYEEWLAARGPHCRRFILPTVPAKAD